MIAQSIIKTRASRLVLPHLRKDASTEDLDPVEIREWLDSLDGVIEVEGPRYTLREECLCGSVFVEL
jgi:hypothetical protein